jgi:hypothetical protein
MTLSTSRAIATFVSIARQAFNNSDFLYLNYIQHTIKTLRSSLVGRNTPLTNHIWNGLAEQLPNHPLAIPTSHEAHTLTFLKKLLWSISSLPLPHDSTDMSIEYKKAVEIGGEAGVKLFAPFLFQEYALLPCPALTVSYI